MTGDAPPRPRSIVVFIWDFFGGGAERVAVTLANAFAAAGHEVRIVAGRDTGPNRTAVHPGIPVLVPPSAAPRAVLAHLRGVLAAHKPDVLLSHQTTRNVIAILAHELSPGRGRRLVVGVEHGEMAHTVRQTQARGLKLYFALTRVLYPLASGIVAVSDNVGASIRSHLGWIPIRPTTLPNPVIFPGFHAQAAAEPDHRFFADRSTPVFVAIGRLEEQKNYSFLLDSFAALIRTRPARLIIYGEGKLRDVLEARRAALGLDAVVDLPGYTDKPFAAMRAADALVLPSVWEGLPTVAIEALACGTQVVSTNNSQGIQAILDGGRLGWITPPGDVAAFAAAMEDALVAPKDREALARQAASYEAAPVADAYGRYFDRLAGGRR